MTTLDTLRSRVPAWVSGLEVALAKGGWSVLCINVHANGRGLTRFEHDSGEVIDVESDERGGLRVWLPCRQPICAAAGGMRDGLKVAVEALADDCGDGVTYYLRQIGGLL